MPLYRVSGIWIRSDDIALDSYAHRGVGDVDVRLDVATSSPPAHVVGHTIEVDGHPVLAFGANVSSWFVRADDLATFAISHDATHVQCHPDPGCAPDALAQMFVDRVVPHLADARGNTAIHASAVSIAGRGAVAFVGDPGAGKSTLSAALCPPCAFVADDCAVLEVGDVVRVHPSYPFARLHGDAAQQLEAADDIHVVATRTHKHRAKRVGETTAQRLAAIYVLQTGDIGVGPMGIRDAIVELARHLYRIAPTDRTRLLSELDRLERVARGVPVRILSYPRRFDSVARVRQLIVDDLGALAKRSSTLSTP